MPDLTASNAALASAINHNAHNHFLKMPKELHLEIFSYLLHKNSDHFTLVTRNLVSLAGTCRHMRDIYADVAHGCYMKAINACQISFEKHTQIFNDLNSDHELSLTRKDFREVSYSHSKRWDLILDAFHFRTKDYDQGSLGRIRTEKIAQKIIKAFDEDRVPVDLILFNKLWDTSVEPLNQLSIGVLEKRLSGFEPDSQFEWQMASLSDIQLRGPESLRIAAAEVLSGLSNQGPLSLHLTE